MENLQLEKLYAMEYSEAAFEWQQLEWAKEVEQRLSGQVNFELVREAATVKLAMDVVGENLDLLTSNAYAQLKRGRLVLEIGMLISVLTAKINLNQQYPAGLKSPYINGVSLRSIDVAILHDSPFQIAFEHDFTEYGAGNDYLNSLIHELNIALAHLQGMQNANYPAVFTVYFNLRNRIRFIGRH